MNGEVGAGSRLGSLYVLDQRIGGGAMGTVWAAHNTESGEAVAVKILTDTLAQNTDVVGRFLRERSALVSVKHPNLVEIRDLVAESERIALVMDLVEGIDAARLLEQNGPMPLGEAARLGTEISQALIAVHAAGIVHRDLKPANILIESATGKAKLVDFGIAWIAGNPRLTAANSVIGTPHYLAPELLTGGAVSPAADVYALGICIYQLLSGMLPFDGEHYAQILYKHLNEAPPPHPAIPPTLWSLIEGMLAKDAASRPTMQFVAGQLASYARVAMPLVAPGGAALPPPPEQTEAAAPEAYEQSSQYIPAPPPLSDVESPAAPDAWIGAPPPFEYSSPPPFSYVQPEQRGRPRRRLLVIAAVGVVALCGAAVGAWALTQGGGGQPNTVASQSAPATTAPVVAPLVTHHWPLCCGQLQESGGTTSATNNGVALNGTNAGDALFDGKAGTQIVVDGPVINTEQSFTIAFWMHMQGATSTPSGRETMVEQRGTEGCAACVEYDPATNRWTFEMQSSDAESAKTVQVETKAPANTSAWNRFIAVYDAQAHTMSLYLGGTLQGTRHFDAGWVPTGPLSFGSGLEKGVTTNWYAGNLADMWIWNRPMTPAQVNQAAS